MLHPVVELKIGTLHRRVLKIRPIFRLFEPLPTQGALNKALDLGLRERGRLQATRSDRQGTTWLGCTVRVGALCKPGSTTPGKARHRPGRRLNLKPGMLGFHLFVESMGF